MLLHPVAHPARDIQTTDTDEAPFRVIAYVRQGGTIGRAHETAVVAACLRRGWELDVVLRDERNDLARPNLGVAFDRLVDSEADGLIVPALDHLAPSLAELEPYFDWFLATGTALVAIAEGLDTSTPAGEAAALRAAHLGLTERRMADLRRDRTANVIRIEHYRREGDRRRRARS